VVVDGELEMEAVGVAGSEVAERRGRVMERPATPSRAVACHDECAGLLVPAGDTARTTAPTDRRLGEEDAMRHWHGQEHRRGRGERWRRVGYGT
jgi:hypothetical protein